MNIVVIGASNKPERYSYKAVMLLREKGHSVFPVHKRIKEIEGIKVFSSISEIQEAVDTVSLYVAADISTRLTGEVLNKSPRRIIFNPGTENPELMTKAQERGIETLNACTLVMLRTNQF